MPGKNINTKIISHERFLGFVLYSEIIKYAIINPNNNEPESPRKILLSLFIFKKNKRNKIINILNEKKILLMRKKVNI